LFSPIRTGYTTKRAAFLEIRAGNTIHAKGGFMSRSRSISTLVLILTLCLQLVACSSLTQENYDKIKVGMSFQEVEKLLGSNPSCDSAMGMKSCTWGTSDRYVKIQFVADKVAIHVAKGLK
jgi:hypothetical protein